MIARSTTLPHPIPFNSGLNGAKPPARPFADPLAEQRLAASQAAKAVSPKPPMPTAWATAAHRPAAIAPLSTAWTQAGKDRPSANDATPSAPPSAGNGRADSPAWPAPKGRIARQALARYDGPHSLSIRSAASGRHYRFEHQGATQVIDAMDIALMRRIEDITLL